MNAVNRTLWENISKHIPYYNNILHKKHFSLYKNIRNMVNNHDFVYFDKSIASKIAKTFIIPHATKKC